MVSLGVVLFDAFLLPLLLLSKCKCKKLNQKRQNYFSILIICIYMYISKAIRNIPFCFCEAYCCLLCCICEFDCLFYSKMTKLVSDKSM